MINKGDLVLHKLSRLIFICENGQQERWMNMNPFYTKDYELSIQISPSSVGYHIYIYY